MSVKTATLAIFVYTTAYGTKNIKKSASTFFLIDLHCEKYPEGVRIRVKWDGIAYRVKLWHRFGKKLNVAVLRVKTATLGFKNDCFLAIFAQTLLQNPEKTLF